MKKKKKVQSLGFTGLTRGGGSGRMAGGFLLEEACFPVGLRGGLCISPGHIAPAKRENLLITRSA